MISYDNAHVSVRTYKDAIKCTCEIDDQFTADLLIKLRKMEVVHIDWAEMQRSLIEQIELENYPANQIKGIQADSKLFDNYEKNANRFLIKNITIQIEQLCEVMYYKFI